MITWPINGEKLGSVFVRVHWNGGLEELALASDKISTCNPTSFFQQSTVDVHRGGSLRTGQVYRIL